MKTNKYVLRICLSAFAGMCLGLLADRFLPADSTPFALMIAASTAAILPMILAHPLHRRYRQEAYRLQEDTHYKDAVIRFITASGTLHTRSELYHLILETAIEAIPQAATGSLLKVLPDGTTRFEAAYGHDIDILSGLTLKLEETFIYVLTGGSCDEAVILNDYKAINERVLDKEQNCLLESATADLGGASIISTPVHLDGELWGMLTIESGRTDSFDSRHIELLNIFVGEMVKVIKLYREQEKNLWLMQHDPLTGLLNRMHFTERIKADLEAASEGKRFGTLISMDLDGFKHINDVFGHSDGDLALVHFSDIFQTHLGETDYLSRYGGDEFMAVFIGKRADEVCSIIEEISQKLLETPLCLDNHCELIRFSHGMVTFDETFNDHARIMHLSDSFMYECKRQHREMHWGPF